MGAKREWMSERVNQVILITRLGFATLATF